jgi:hypothetical protein
VLVLQTEEVPDKTPAVERKRLASEILLRCFNVRMGRENYV